MKVYTLKNEIIFKGIGLHKGKENKVILRPKREIGRRIFLIEKGKEIEIPFSLQNVETSYRCIAFKKDDKIVFTLEHLLSALHGFYNIYCDIIIEGDEIPCFDTSAHEFVSEIKKVGVEELGEIEPFKLKNPVSLSFEENKEIIFIPSDIFKVTYIFKKEKGLEGFLSIDITPENYEKELSKAKTFIFYEEIEEVRKRGLGKGGDEKNVLVFKDGEWINKEILTYPDEFLRHKILDLIGDFSLLNYPLSFHIVAIGTGHRHHVEAIKKLKKYLVKDEIEIKEILKLLPHKYPFLLVDRVLSVEENRIVGIKNVTFNENFFQGHFPENPIMPGVLIVEALAQTGGILISKKIKEKKLFYFAGINNVKFRKPVLPGDTLIMEVEIIRWGGKVCKMYGKAYVNDEIVAEGELTAISEGG
ncbi:MAG: 3-hydroxyacyl-ACP dehydratase FabZ [candidate division WOR-3 bacterium]